MVVAMSLDAKNASCSTKPTERDSEMQTQSFAASFLALLLLAPPHALADPHEVTMDKDGTANIKCQCIADRAGCASKILNQIGGDERAEWHQMAAVLAGHKYDLSMLCYKKRDVEKMGEGNCCKFDGDERDIRFFWGDLYSLD